MEALSKRNQNLDSTTYIRSCPEKVGCLDTPNHQRWYAKWKLRWNMSTLHGTRFFCTFGANLYAQLVLLNKILALELSRKFIKSALLVGHTLVASFNI